MRRVSSVFPNTTYTKIDSTDCLQELASITDTQVFAIIRQADIAEGKWLVEDPPLSILQHVLQAGI
jgi:hypothetical protein